MLKPACPRARAVQQDKLPHETPAHHTSRAAPLTATREHSRAALHTQRRRPRTTPPGQPRSQRPESTHAQHCTLSAEKHTDTAALRQPRTHACAGGPQRPVGSAPNRPKKASIRRECATRASWLPSAYKVTLLYAYTPLQSIEHATALCLKKSMCIASSEILYG